MPIAVVVTEIYEKELKTLPEGKVTLRKLSYGEVLERREMSAKMHSRMGGKATSRDGEGVPVEIDFLHLAVQVFDFSRCIVEHNLQDSDGKPLNLSTAPGIKSLDPRVGQEIEELIDDLNNPPSSEEESTFRPRSKEESTG